MSSLQIIRPPTCVGGFFTPIHCLSLKTWLNTLPLDSGVLSLSMVRYTLSKKERLSSLKAIEKLFKDGRSMTKYPIRLVWLNTTTSAGRDFPVQVMFSASKKKFSRAVDRNRIKRLLREGYRLYKPTFYDLLPPDTTWHLSIIYTGNDIQSKEVIQNKIILALGSMLNELIKTKS